MRSEETKSLLSVILVSAMKEYVFLLLLLRMGSLPARGSKTSVTVSHKLSAVIPPKHRPASHEINSASVLLYATADCFLQVQLIGTNVWLPKMHDTAKSASWQGPHSDVLFPPHDSTVCNHSQHGCWKSVCRSAYHKLCSICWCLLPSNSQTTQCQAYQCELHARISGRVVNTCLIATFRGRKINFTNSKTLFGRCRDRPWRALPWTRPDVKELLFFKKKERNESKKKM